MATTEFWDKQHSDNNILWLTDSIPDKVLRRHKLELPADSHVLDIGTGTGGFARWCASRGNKVSSCDVSKLALTRVSDIADIALVHNIHTLKPADIAICHLVFQHCRDEQVLQILNGANLKRGATFSFQYAIKTGELNPELQKAEDDSLLYFRSPEEMDKLLEKVPTLRVAWRSGPFAPSKSENSIAWEIIHCEADYIKNFHQARSFLNQYHSVLDIGCGQGEFIRLQGGVPVRAGVDICAEALEFAESKDVNNDVIYLRHDLLTIERLFPVPMFDVVMGTDIIEHFTESDAKGLIEKCEYIAKKCTLFFIPVGDHEQHDYDPWGYGNEYYNAHRSTWKPDDMKKLGYEVWHWPTWHKERAEAKGAMWCRKFKG
jgi:2-polyprenyl-3-methyl-5-hydroxy-6-metoxy-1,4-benzoquinol methylase